MPLSRRCRYRSTYVHANLAAACVVVVGAVRLSHARRPHWGERCKRDGGRLDQKPTRHSVIQGGPKGQKKKDAAQHQVGQHVQLASSVSCIAPPNWPEEQRSPSKVVSNATTTHNCVCRRTTHGETGTRTRSSAPAARQGQNLLPRAAWPRQGLSRRYIAVRRAVGTPQRRGPQTICTDAPWGCSFTLVAHV